MMWCDIGGLLLPASIPLATLPGLPGRRSVAGSSGCSAPRAICADAATCALSALSLFLIRKPAPEPRAEGRKMKREIADGF